MNSLAKQMTLCDNCRANLSKDESGDTIQATLNNNQQKPQDFHFCQEECLRQFLNGRAKKKKSTAAIFEISCSLLKK